MKNLLIRAFLCAKPRQWWDKLYVVPILVGVLCVSAVYSDDAKPKPSGAERISELIKQLGVDDWQTRESVEKELIELVQPGTAGFAQLKETNKTTDDPEVRARTARIIPYVETKQFVSERIRKEIPEIWQRLTSNDPRGRTGLFTDLTGMEIISQMRGDIPRFDIVYDKEKRYEVAEQELEQIIKGLLRNVDTPTIEWKRFVIAAVNEYEISSLAPEVATFLEEKDISLLDAAVRCLGDLGEKQYAPPIAKLLDKKSTELRNSVIEALVNLEAKEFAPRIAEYLDDENLRDDAINALAELGAKEFAPRIAKLLDRKDKDLRQTVMLALRELGAKEFAPQIAKLLTDKDSDVRDIAVRSLRVLEAREFIPQIVPLLKDEDGEVRWHTILALGELGAKKFASQVAEFLSSEDWMERACAALSLGKMKAREFGPQMVKLTEDKSRFVRERIAIALGELGDKEFAPSLVKLLEDKSRDVRIHAIRSLAQLGCRESGPEIAKQLTHPHFSVKLEAVKALDTLYHTEAKESLAKLLDDKDPLLKVTVIKALLKMEGDANIAKKGIDIIKQTGSYEKYDYKGRPKDYDYNDFQSAAAEMLFCCHKLIPDAGKYYEAIKTTKVKTPNSDSFQNIIKAIGKQTSLSFQLDSGINAEDLTAVIELKELQNKEVTVEELLWKINEELTGTYTIIIQGDAIKITPIKNAVEYWESKIK